MMEIQERKKHTKLQHKLITLKKFIQGFDCIAFKVYK